jgi:hypothetical protein
MRLSQAPGASLASRSHSHNPPRSKQLLVILVHITHHHLHVLRPALILALHYGYLLPLQDLSMQGIDEPLAFSHVTQQRRIGIAPCPVLQDLIFGDRSHRLVIVFEELVAVLG